MQASFHQNTILPKANNGPALFSIMRVLVHLVEKLLPAQIVHIFIRSNRVCLTASGHNYLILYNRDCVTFSPKSPLSCLLRALRNECDLWETAGSKLDMWTRPHIITLRDGWTRDHLILSYFGRHLLCAVQNASGCKTSHKKVCLLSLIVWSEEHTSVERGPELLSRSSIRHGRQSRELRI